MTSAARRIEPLVELGAVERVGRGRGVRYLLAPSYYKAIGKSGAYTRKRGLDRHAGTWGQDPSLEVPRDLLESSHRRILGEFSANSRLITLGKSLILFNFSPRTSQPKSLRAAK